MEIALLRLSALKRRGWKNNNESTEINIHGLWIEYSLNIGANLDVINLTAVHNKNKAKVPIPTGYPNVHCRRTDFGPERNI